MTSRLATPMNGNIPVLVLRLISILLQLVYIKLYTHFLSVDELGRYFYLIALSYVANALIFVPLDYFQQAKLVKFYDQAIPASSLVRLNGMASILALTFLLLAGIPFWYFGKINASELPEIFLYSLLLHICSSSRNLLNNVGRKTFVAAILITETGLRSTLFWIFEKITSASANTLFKTSLLALLIETLVIAFFFRKFVNVKWFEDDVFSFSKSVREAYPISFSAVCNWLQVQSYRLIYVTFGFASTAGVYATVANVGSVGMNAVAQIAAQILNPQLYRTRGAFLKRYVFISLLLVASVLIGLALLGKFTLRILTKPEFEAHWEILLLGAATEGFSFIIGILTTYLTIASRANVLIRANLLGVFFAAGGFYAVYLYDFANWYLVGVPIVGSQAAVCTYLLFLTRKQFR
ncbi:hypothetical protein [Pigmentiphaga litoralis]|uniref:hypothetical protein n=1 Tax=Pigmentiphaga litoralis TaxID=516702 RepID=UPI003B4324E9